MTLKELEKQHIIKTLKENPSLGECAKILDIDPAALFRKRVLYKIYKDKRRRFL